MSDSITSYAQLGAYVNKILGDNAQLPVGGPHKPFWDTLSYDQFINGNVPNVKNPENGLPLKILEVGNAGASNFIQALEGTPGSLFDPNTGAFGQMPASGPPYFTAAQIAPIAAWINAGCPN